MHAIPPRSLVFVNRGWAGLAIAAALALICAGSEAPDDIAGATTPATRQHAAGDMLLATLPTPLVPNLGQWSHEAGFVGRFGAMTAFLTEGGWTLSLVEHTHSSTDGQGTSRSVAVRMAFAGAADARLVAERRLPGVHHYLLGNDPRSWRRDVPLFGAVRLAGIYEGVDARVRENDGHMEYDLLLAPGADVGCVEIRVEGARSLRVRDDGSLCIDTELGPITQPRPATWQVDADGSRHPMECDYVLFGPDSFGFRAPGRHPDQAMVVDPPLIFGSPTTAAQGPLYSTYLGGRGSDLARAIAVDDTGHAYVTGDTASTNFPTQQPIQTSRASDDVFVTKLDPTGSTLVYSTYLGGQSRDHGLGIAVGSTGEAYITGQTFSDDFPVQAALKAKMTGYGDAFVAKLDASGSALAYSTYLGGGLEVYPEYATGVVVNELGQATVTGQTWAYDFPVRNAFLGSYSTNGDAFVTKLEASGSALVYSTYLGGSQFEEAHAIGTDSSGHAYVTGWTISPNFSVHNALQPTLGGPSFGHDLFVAKFDPTGSVVYSTYLGGTSTDEGNAITADDEGNAYITGLAGDNYPLKNPLQGQQVGFDAFVTKLNPTGSALVYSTYLGGNRFDLGSGIAVDDAGNAYVTGYTASPNFPLQNPAQGVYGGGQYFGDAFVTRINAAGSALSYSTYLGGTGDERGEAITADRAGHAYVVGGTGSNNFPVQGAFQANRAGSGDAFVSKLETTPLGCRSLRRQHARVPRHHLDQRDGRTERHQHELCHHGLQRAAAFVRRRVARCRTRRDRDHRGGDHPTRESAGPRRPDHRGFQPRSQSISSPELPRLDRRGLALRTVRVHQHTGVRRRWIVERQRRARAHHPPLSGQAYLSKYGLMSSYNPSSLAYKT